MTHAPKFTFNPDSPDPIWDKKWNYMDPCQTMVCDP